MPALGEMVHKKARAHQSRTGTVDRQRLANGDDPNVQRSFVALMNAQ